MITPTFISSTAVLFTAIILTISQSSAAIVAANFGTDVETTPTDAFTSVQIPQSVPSGSWQNLGGDRSVTSVTLPAGAVALNGYYDASKVIGNYNTASSSSPFRGYLDDGTYDNSNANTGWAIEISGLSAWMAANNSTEWRLVILRSTDYATNGFRDISIHTGTTAALTSSGYLTDPSALWLTDPAATSVIDNWPDGGTASTITNGTFVSTGGNSGYSETNVFTGNTDAFILRDTGVGKTSGQRGSIAGLILYTVPEPSTSLMTAMMLGGFAARRRRR